MCAFELLSEINNGIKFIDRLGIKLVGVILGKEEISLLEGVTFKKLNIFPCNMKNYIGFVIFHRWISFKKGVDNG